MNRITEKLAPKNRIKDAVFLHKGQYQEFSQEPAIYVTHIAEMREV